jgi:hypothetical protein
VVASFLWTSYRPNNVRLAPSTTSAPSGERRPVGTLYNLENKPPSHERLVIPINIQSNLS